MGDRWVLRLTVPFTLPAGSERGRLARSLARVFLEEALLPHPRVIKSVPALYFPGLIRPAAIPVRVSTQRCFAGQGVK